MNENQKAFILRHIRALLKKGEAPNKALQQSLIVLKNDSLSKEVLQHYSKSNSLIETLSKFEVIDINEVVVKGLQHTQDPSRDALSLEKLIETNQTISDIYSLLKVKLSVGLGYALWLSIFATGIFSLVNFKILPQFEAIFTDFGSELPGFTKAAIAWQNSFFSPTIIGILLVGIIGFFIFSINTLPIKKILEKKTFQTKFIANLPFMKSVVIYTQSINWLSYFATLTAAGNSYQGCYEILSVDGKKIKEFLPDFEENAQTAESIGNLHTEINYQSHQLELQAEGLVTNTVRKLVAFVMTFVVIFVVFTIFASYLPIFQLGAVV